MADKETLSSEQAALLETLRARFEQNPGRHEGLSWAGVQARLMKSPDKLESLRAMEQTGGEPDVIGYDQGADAYLFCDCSPETPAGRRSLCYDGAALHARKEHKPQGSATDMASAMGVCLLTEDQYRTLQRLGRFDTKTSSWILTPPEIRNLGGALFGDRRYGHVFLYHNGAESYYGSRGFRGMLKV